jgi:hypothetical protein
MTTETLASIRRNSPSFLVSKEASIGGFDFRIGMVPRWYGKS